MAIFLHDPLRNFLSKFLAPIVAWVLPIWPSFLVMWMYTYQFKNLFKDTLQVG
jgi:hypothetical protein